MTGPYEKRKFEHRVTEGRHREKIAVNKSMKETSKETNFADTLISDV